MKVNVIKSSKNWFSSNETGAVFHVTSKYHGVEDVMLMIVNMGEGNGTSFLNLETGMKWDVLNEGRIATKISEIGFTLTINDLHASGKYTFTKVKAELNVEV